jgi:integrase/recombinase XerD
VSCIYRRGKTWWYRSKIDGKSIYESLATTSRAVAKAKQKKLDERRGSNVTQKHLLADLAKAHSALMQQTRSRSHAANVRQRLKRFLDDHPRVKMPDDITHDVVQAWFQRLTKGGCAPRTVNGYRVALGGFCRQLCRSGHLTANPCQDVVLPRMTEQPTPSLDDREVELTLRIARRRTNDIYLPVLVALKTGMRSDEIRRMRWEDVRFDQGAITIPKTKVHKPRTIPLHPELAEALRQCAKPSGPVFVGEMGGCVGDKQWARLLRPVQRWIPKYRQQTGCGRAWHLLRHTFASRYMAAGGNVYALSKILGHSTVKTTERYVHWAKNSSDPILEKI